MSWIDKQHIGFDSDANKEPPELPVHTILTSLTDAITFVVKEDLLMKSKLAMT